ncbi:hypothetical protein [Aeromicrobium sp. 179-A 4D2 NHS]|uniref:hypothetical protein n=1 Tax=Aeromicrobium sp. 179-A 4D2 NHS TaxID=3142375 RepID=UPI0039A3A1C1
MLRTKTHTPRFHVVTIDADTGAERVGRFNIANAVPGFIGVPDIFAAPSLVERPDWPDTPDGYERLTRGISGSPTDTHHRHYFIFKAQEA